MQNIKNSFIKDKFFYLSLVLSIAVVLNIYRFADAQSAVFVSPIAPPPESNVAIPVDTSNVAQNKVGSLTIGDNFDGGVGVRVVNGLLEFFNGQNKGQIGFSNGIFGFNDGTNGFLPFPASGGDNVWNLDSDISAIYPANLSYRVGVGTNNPQAAFDVRGNAAHFGGETDTSLIDVNVFGSINVNDIPNQSPSGYVYVKSGSGATNFDSNSAILPPLTFDKFVLQFPELSGKENLRVNANDTDDCVDSSLVERGCNDSFSAKSAADSSRPEVYELYAFCLGSCQVEKYNLYYVKYAKIPSTRLGGSLNANQANFSGAVNVGGDLNVEGVINAKSGIRFNDGRIQTTKSTLSCRVIRNSFSGDGGTARCGDGEFLTGGGCYWNEVENVGDDNIGARPVDSGNNALTTGATTFREGYRCSRDTGIGTKDKDAAWAICCKIQ